MGSEEGDVETGWNVDSGILDGRMEGRNEG